MVLLMFVRIAGIGEPSLALPSVIEKLSSQLDFRGAGCVRIGSSLPWFMLDFADRISMLRIAVGMRKVLVSEWKDGSTPTVANGELPQSLQRLKK